MRLLLAYLLLVHQEQRNKDHFDVHATTLRLMEEDAGLDKSVINLTMDDNLSVTEFVDLTKDPELFHLCSSSSASSTSISKLSEIIPHNLLQHSSNSSDSDISSAVTGRHQGLPNPQLIGALIRFKSPRQQQQGVATEPKRSSIVPSVLFFICSNATRL